jgi:hypothetical protein
VTTPSRTISDLRRTLPPDQIDAAIRRAEVLRLDIGTQPGYEPDLARSELERRFVRICRKHALPLPEVNQRVGPYWVDFLWRDRRLISRRTATFTTEHAPPSNRIGNGTFGCA